MNNVNGINRENLSLRTQDILKAYAAKKAATAAAADDKKAESYEDTINRIMKESEARRAAMRKPAEDNAFVAKSGMSGAELAAKKAGFAPTIIAGGVETRVYTGPIDGLAAKKTAAEAPVQAAAENTVERTFAYKKAINELAAKHNLDDKMKSRNVDAELDKLIAKKLTGTNNEQLMIRSDVPAVVENYQVQKGDTLAGISKKFYKDAFLFKNIATVNEQKAPYKLAEGQNLRVVYHKVTAAAGDTLESISEKFTGGKVSAKSLAGINNLTTLAGGESILVPVQFTAVADKADEAARTADAGNSVKPETVKAAEAEIRQAEKKAAEKAMISRMPEAPEREAEVERARRRIEKLATQIDRIAL